MKIINFFVVFAAFSYSAFAQIDVLKFKKVQFGAIYDRTNLTGFYTLTNPNTGELFFSQKDYISTIGFEAKHVVMSETGVFTGNLEGFLYMLGRLISLGEKKALFNDWDTYLDPLTAGDLHNVKFKSGSDYNEVAKVSNNHLLDFTASWAFKRGGAAIGGVNIACRTLGFPPRYTTYPTELPKDYTSAVTVNGTWKILYGLNFGYRKNLNDKLALLILGGVNTGLNKWGSDKSTAIQVLYCPFFNPTLYFGGKYGGYVSLYWEFMKGKDQTIPYVKKTQIGIPEIEQKATNEVTATQFQIKAGFYISFKNEGS